MSCPHSLSQLLGILVAEVPHCPLLYSKRPLAYEGVLLIPEGSPSLDLYSKTQAWKGNPLDTKKPAAWLTVISFSVEGPFIENGPQQLHLLHFFYLALPTSYPQLTDIRVNNMI